MIEKLIYKGKMLYPIRIKDGECCIAINGACEISNVTKTNKPHYQNLALEELNFDTDKKWDASFEDVFKNKDLNWEKLDVKEEFLTDIITKKAFMEKVETTTRNRNIFGLKIIPSWYSVGIDLTETCGIVFAMSYFRFGWDCMIKTTQKYYTT